MSTLKPGEKAPDFTLMNQAGKPVNFYRLLGKNHVVLYFYPKNETAVCTKEACLFRDQYEDFSEAGAEVVGVSSDSVRSHQSFASGRKLPFVLLSDPDHAVHNLYGAGPALFGLFKSRITYLIDSAGIVRNVFSSQLNADKHVSEALKVLKSLPAPAIKS